MALIAVSLEISARNDDPVVQGFSRCWSFPTVVDPRPGISADDTQAYFVDHTGRLTAIDLKSGAVAWTAEIGGDVQSELVVVSGRVFVVSAPIGVAAANQKPSVRTFSAHTGLPIWNVSLPTSSRYFLAADTKDISIVSGTGDIWHLETETGTIRWNASAKGTVSSPQKIEGRRLIIAVDEKRIEEFSVENGAKIASAKVEGTPAFVGAGKSSAAVYSDARGNVNSIQMGGGKNWKFRAGGKIVYIRPVDENVLLGSADNFVYFMSVEYGNLLWKRRLPGRVAHGGIVGKDLAVFTVVGDRSAYLIELEKGRIVDRVDLVGDDAYLMTPVRANGKYIIAATANGLLGFSTACSNEKSGK